ncbi:alpha-ketoglutarate-dependent dioxygenase AlkB [Pseudoalteromonas xiamenensis]|uniref:alpha-ketoglutarate-dependent dioxygenase AlkB family protein n=1 Tax=Pseudoalteromonas xiamenensis TaxID=882626 RepID=UPI0027E5BDA6|nr:alpha-ketoglutarate-dependent dioxygenase AlkB [Pseudoalteromonas xiamenensis]WMN59173.1 alpha-ketoglutarate-dependent dioxygenase AlkB [Pseudoalteromonas xiamenensis]
MFELSQKPDLPNGFQYLMPVISTQKAWSLFDFLQSNINWQQPSIRVYGKFHPIPRLQCYVADSGLNYQYSALNLRPEAWNEPLFAMRQRLETAFKQPFNAVLLNYYRNGLDCMGWHSDDEPELGDNPTIVSVSLGAARKFAIKDRETASQWQLYLEHGSALVMTGVSQQLYVHSLPKQRKVGEGRINLTFRNIVNK